MRSTWHKPPSEFPRRDDRGNESVIDPHARFNGKYVSDRDLRIEGEAQGEIECQGTLIISPQARVRSAIKAHNVIVNGDYEGDVDCGGRFEIGSTGRVKGNIKTQVLVVKEGAHWEGGVTMTREPGARPATQPAVGPGQPAQAGRQQPRIRRFAGSIFSKGEREGQRRRGRTSSARSSRLARVAAASSAPDRRGGIGARRLTTARSRAARRVPRRTAGARRGHAGGSRRIGPPRVGRGRRARRRARSRRSGTPTSSSSCARARSPSSSRRSSPPAASTSTSSARMRWPSWRPATRARIATCGWSRRSCAALA